MGIIVGFIILLMSWVIYYHADNYCNTALEEFEKSIAVILMMFSLVLSYMLIIRKFLC